MSLYSRSSGVADTVPFEGPALWHRTQVLETRHLLSFQKVSLNGWVGAAAGISESADFGTAGPTLVCTNSWLDINTLTCTLHKLRIKITVIWIKLGNRENSSFHKIYCFGHICAWSGSNLHCFTQRRCSPILIARDHLAILSDAGLDGWVTLEWTFDWMSLCAAETSSYHCHALMHTCQSFSFWRSRALLRFTRHSHRGICMDGVHWICLHATVGDPGLLFWVSILCGLDRKMLSHPKGYKCVLFLLALLISITLIYNWGVQANFRNTKNYLGKTETHTQSAITEYAHCDGGFLGGKNPELLERMLAMPNLVKLA